MRMKVNGFVVYLARLQLQYGRCMHREMDYVDHRSYLFAPCYVTQP
jgi:hypothetical protein